jgi:hypothetical protein
MPASFARAFVLLSLSSVVDTSCGGSGSSVSSTTGPPQPPSVASVSATIRLMQLQVGDTAQVSVVLKDAAGNVLSGRTVSFLSGAPSIASITSGGLVTAVSLGSAEISASSEGQSASLNETVVNVPVASVSVEPGTVTLNVGSSRQLAAVLTDAAGRTLSGRTVVWSSSDIGIATVSATGLVVAAKSGIATIIATSEGKSGTARVTVAASVLDLLPHYAYGESIGSIKVFSDISQSFSHDHAVNLDKTWRYYTSFFGASPGSHLEMYYTRDSATYVGTFAYCPAVWFVNAREVNACWNVYGDGAWIFFVIPYVTPDYATQYHEISHTFLQKVHPDDENFPWLKEGSGMYFESGAFDDAGNFSVSMPLAYVRDGFHQYDTQNALIPLATLLTMPRTDFYSGLAAGNGVKTYAQSGLFFTYLMKQYPAMMTGMFAQFRNGALAANTDVLAYITSNTGRTVAQLEQDYIAYGRSLP